MFYVFFILRLRLLPTAKSRSLSWPNIWVRPKVKIPPYGPTLKFTFCIQSCPIFLIYQPVGYVDQGSILMTKRILLQILSCDNCFLADNVHLYVPHCYFTRLNRKRTSPFKFRLPALLRKNIQITYMQGLKSAFLEIFQTGPGWPCPVSTAIKNPLLDFKNYFCFGFLKMLEVKTRKGSIW